MKTKKLILLCLFTGIGITQLLAQDWSNFPPDPKNEKGNGTVQYYNIWTDYYQDVYCNGELADELVGAPNIHMAIMFKDGIPIRTNERISGEVNSTWTGETFKLNESDKIEWLEGDYYEATWNFNLKGNNGSHYIGSMTWNYITEEFVINRLVCAGKKD